MENKVILENENHEEEEFNVILTFEDPNTKFQYMFLQKEEEEEVFVYRYDDEGNLFPIEDEKEWEMVNEVLGAFNEEE